MARILSDTRERRRSHPAARYARQPPLDRAEGFRYLTRILRLALESELENAEPMTPRLQLGCRADIKFACDNPDSYYLKAKLDSRHE